MPAIRKLNMDRGMDVTQFSRQRQSQRHAQFVTMRLEGVKAADIERPS
jgi:hypothetical protein